MDEEQFESFLSAENISLDETIISDQSKTPSTCATPKNQVNPKPTMDVNYTPVTYITNLLKKMKIFSPASSSSSGSSKLVEIAAESSDNTLENASLSDSTMEDLEENREFVIKWSRDLNQSVESIDTFHDTISFPNESDKTMLQSSASSSYFSGKSTADSTLENCLNQGKLDVLTDLSKDESFSLENNPLEKFHDTIPFQNIEMHSTVLVDPSFSESKDNLNVSSGQTVEDRKDATLFTIENNDSILHSTGVVSFNKPSTENLSMQTLDSMDESPDTLAKIPTVDLTPNKNFNIFDSTGIQNVDLAKTFSESENLTEISKIVTEKSVIDTNKTLDVKSVALPEPDDQEALRILQEMNSVEDDICETSLKMIVEDEKTFENFLNDGTLNAVSDLINEMTESKEIQDIQKSPEKSFQVPVENSGETQTISLLSGSPNTSKISPENHPTETPNFKKNIFESTGIQNTDLLAKTYSDFENLTQITNSAVEEEEKFVVEEEKTFENFLNDEKLNALSDLTNETSEPEIQDTQNVPINPDEDPEYSSVEIQPNNLFPRSPNTSKISFENQPTETPNFNKNVNIFESTGIQNTDLLAKTYSEFENLTQISRAVAEEEKSVVEDEKTFENFLNDGKLNALSDLTNETSESEIQDTQNVPINPTEDPEHSSVENQPDNLSYESPNTSKISSENQPIETPNFNKNVNVFESTGIQNTDLLVKTFSEFENLTQIPRAVAEEEKSAVEDEKTFENFLNDGKLNALSDLTNETSEPEIQDTQKSPEKSSEVPVENSEIIQPNKLFSGSPSTSKIFFENQPTETPNFNKNVNIFESTGIQNTDLLVKTSSEFENLTQIPRTVAEEEKSVVEEEKTFENFLNDGKLNVLSNLTNDISEPEEIRDPQRSPEKTENLKSLENNFESPILSEDPTKISVQYQPSLVVDFHKPDSTKIGNIFESTGIQNTDLLPKTFSESMTFENVTQTPEAVLVKEDGNPAEILVENLDFPESNPKKTIDLDDSTGLDSLVKGFSDLGILGNFNQISTGIKEDLIETIEQNPIVESTQNVHLELDENRPNFEISSAISQPQENFLPDNTQNLDNVDIVHDNLEILIKESISIPETVEKLEMTNFGKNQENSSKTPLPDELIDQIDNKEGNLESPIIEPIEFCRDSLSKPKSSSNIENLAIEKSPKVEAKNHGSIIVPIEFCTKENDQNIPNRAKPAKNDSALKEIKSIASNVIDNILDKVTFEMNNDEDKSWTQMQFELEEKAAENEQNQEPSTQTTPQVVPNTEAQFFEFKKPASPSIENEVFGSAEDFFQRQTFRTPSPRKQFKPRESILLAFDPIMNRVNIQNNSIEENQNEETNVDDSDLMPRDANHSKSTNSSNSPVDIRKIDQLFNCSVPLSDSSVDQSHSIIQESMKTVQNSTVSLSTTFREMPMHSTPDVANSSINQEPDFPNTSFDKKRPDTSNTAGIFDHISRLALNIKTSKTEAEQQMWMDQIKNEVAKLHKIQGTIPPKRTTPVKPPVNAEEIEKKLAYAEQLAQKIKELKEENAGIASKNQEIRNEYDNTIGTYTNYYSKYKKLKTDIEERKMRQESMIAMIEEQNTKIQLQKMADVISLKELNADIEKVTNEIGRVHAEEGVKVDVLKARVQQSEIKYHRLEKAIEQKNNEFKQLNDICEGLMKK